jgi:hypothetical protein
MSIVEITEDGKKRYWEVKKPLTNAIEVLAGSIRGGKPADRVIVNTVQDMVTRATGDKEGDTRKEGAQLKIISEK